LYQPQMSLRGQALANAARQLTNLTYDPAIKELSMQLAQNAQQGSAAEQRTSDYYNQLLPYAQSSAAGSQAISDKLNATLADIGAQAQQTIGQQTLPPAVQDLVNRGLGAGAPEQLAAQIAAQKATAANQSQAQQAYGAEVGSNAARLAQQSLGTYALRGQERLGNIAAATRLAAEPINQKIASEQVAKASAYTANLGKLRQQEFNNLVTAQGLGIRQQAIQQTAANVAAQQTGATARTKLTQAGANARAQANNDPNRVGSAGWARVQAANTAAKNAATRAAKGGAGGTPQMTTTENNTYWKNITRIQARFRWLYSVIGAQPGASPASTQLQALNALKTGRVWMPPIAGAKVKLSNGQANPNAKWHWANIPPEGDVGLVNVAFNSTNGGGLSPGDVAYLRARGFTVGNLMPIGNTKTYITTPRQAPATSAAQGGTGGPPILPAR
jgi:hypothetical protein